MELGATVCTKAAPQCEVCPLRDGCEARRTGRIDALPVPKPRRAPVPIRLAAVVATRGTGTGAQVWLERGEGSLFGGLWGVPTKEVEGDASGVKVARMAMRSSGVTARLETQPVGRLEHILSHRRLDVHVFHATAARGMPDPSRRLVAPADLAGLGVSRLTHKILTAAGIA